jgi:hypothetical protein
MNTVAPIKTDEVTTQPGTQLVLDRADTGWTIKSGRVELFMAAMENGKQISSRHFLLEAKAGDIVLPLLEPLQGMRVLLITPESSVLVPSKLEGFGAATVGLQGMAQFAGQVDRWLVGVSMAAAAVVGLPPGSFPPVIFLPRNCAKGGVTSAWYQNAVEL